MQQAGNCLLYYYRTLEKKRGQAKATYKYDYSSDKHTVFTTGKFLTEVCFSRVYSDLSRTTYVNKVESMSLWERGPLYS